MAIDTATDSISIREAEKDLSAIIDRARETKRPVIVTQNGSAAVVVLDATQYQKDMDERDLYRALAHGLASKTTHSLEEVEAELDGLRHMMLALPHSR